MTKKTNSSEKLTVRLDPVSYSVLLMLKRDAGGSFSDVIRRLMAKGKVHPSPSVLTARHSISFRLTAKERAELNIAARRNGVEVAELIRRMLRFYTR